MTENAELAVSGEVSADRHDNGEESDGREAYPGNRGNDSLDGPPFASSPNRGGIWDHDQVVRRFAEPKFVALQCRGHTNMIDRANQLVIPRIDDPRDR
jgi:hypothetical protein